MLRSLWANEEGFIVSAELVIVATVLVIGLLVGLVTIRDQVIQELADTAASYARIGQSYSYSGVTGHASSSAGTVFTDRIDFCQGVIQDDPAGQAAHCIAMTVPASTEDT